VALRRAQVCPQPLLILAEAEPLLILAEQSPLAAVPPAPGPHSRCNQALAGFHRVSESRRVAFILSAPDPRVGLSTNVHAAVALRRATVCTLPLSFRAGQSLLAAASPAPGLPHSVSRQLGRFSPFLGGFHRRAFILSAPGLHGGPLQLSFPRL